MDSVTQAVLGAAVQGAILGKTQGRRALAYGAVLGTLPDLDVLVRYADPVSMMTYHRGFSHSVFVLTALAALLAWLIRKVWPHAPYSGRRLFVALWLVLVTHPVLDAFTVYGTQLFWPLAWTPESWAAIFIIDPIYTVPLLLAVLFAAVVGLKGQGAQPSRGQAPESTVAPGRARGVAALVLALAFSTAYLSLGLAGREVAARRVGDALKAEGIEVQTLRAVPVTVNAFIWRVIAKTPDGHYYEAITSLFDRDRVRPAWHRYPLNLEAAQVLRGVALHERLRWFTDDWLRYDVVGDALVVSDLRMGIPGRYTFRFKMAECDASGHWQVRTPAAWPGHGISLEAMKPILQRTFDQQVKLPLAEWAVADPVGTAPRAACKLAPAVSAVAGQL